MKHILFSSSLLLAGISASQAAITYVDATASNTTAWAGGTFAAATNATANSDNLWEPRTVFGNGGTIYEANGNSGTDTENAPLLVLSVSGLTPGQSYQSYVYYWATLANGGSNWRIGATGDINGINNNGTPGTLGDDFLPVTPAYHFSSVTNAGGTATIGTLASLSTYTTSPLFVEADRTLLQANLGVAVADGTGTLKIYVDDFATGSQIGRTWLDGAGYESIPEPSSVLLSLLGMAALVRRRR